MCCGCSLTGRQSLQIVVFWDSVILILGKKNSLFFYTVHHIPSFCPLSEKILGFNDRYHTFQTANESQLLINKIIFGLTTYKKQVPWLKQYGITGGAIGASHLLYLLFQCLGLCIHGIQIIPICNWTFIAMFVHFFSSTDIQALWEQSIFFFCSLFYTWCPVEE